MAVSEARRHPALATHEAAHWHALQREGELSAAQRAQFMDWLVASPEHLREYLAITRIAGELGEALRAMPIDLDAASAGEAGQAPPDNVVALPLRPHGARVSASYRDRYLTAVPGGNGNSEAGVNASLHLDLSLQYRFRPGWTLLLQGNNLTDQADDQYVDASNRVYSYTRSGRQYFAGVRLDL